MGWADCGEDSKGRPIGYAFSDGVTCDHPGCETKIDRGLAFACGDMHGGDVWECERYFCEAHQHPFREPFEGRCLSVCAECLKANEKEIRENYEHQKCPACNEPVFVRTYAPAPAGETEKCDNCFTELCSTGATEKGTPAGEVAEGA